MNLLERSNYLIALLLSLIFHFLLLLLLLPGYMASSKPPAVDTFPVGLVEIATGSPDGSVGMIGSLPQGAEGTPSERVTNPVEGKEDKGKMNAKPVLNSKSPHEDAFLLPKKENMISESGKTPSKGGTQAVGGEGIGSGNVAGTGKPFGFGSGEGLVTVLGALPTYPKNAMNEGKEGNVSVRILVKADGGLEKAYATKSSGDSRLDRVSISTIERNWKFKAVTKDYYIDLIFSFNVESGVTVKFINSESRP